MTATTATDLPFDDGALADDRLADALGRAGIDIRRPRSVYLRHKPGHSRIVGVEAVDPDGAPMRGYLRSFADPAEAADTLAKAVAMGPTATASGPGVVGVDAHTVWWSLPNDGRLRRLRWYLDPRKLKRSMTGLTVTGAPVSQRASSVEVLRHKPERRVVAAVTLGDRDGGARRLITRVSTRCGTDEARCMTRLAAAGVGVPTPVAVFDGGRVTVQTFEPGSELFAVPASGAVEAGRRVGDAVARLHATPPAPFLPRRRPVTELGRVEEGLAHLCLRHPGLAVPARAALASLASCSPAWSREVWLHGDLHHHNLLLDGERVTLLDLDRTAIGPPGLDLGSLIGHAEARSLMGDDAEATRAAADAAVAAYRAIAPGAVPDAELRFWSDLQLVEQALLVGRRPDGRGDRVEVVTRLLDAVASRADNERW